MNKHIICNRLFVQKLTDNSTRSDPGSLVAYMGAVQAQDYAGAKWALGLRLEQNDREIDEAFAAGKIIRTHVLRPTWHFVAPQDLIWMLHLSAARINQACAYNFKRLELNDKVFNKSNAILQNSLKGNKQLDRLELARFLSENGILTDDLRLIHLLIRAEIDGVICSGGRKGKQFTYALLDERLKEVKQFNPADPLAELALRYFTSHGPATLQDYTWWSGLKASDAKAGLEMVKEKLVFITANGKDYWMHEDAPLTQKVPSIILLPAYDEYTVAYKDRSDILAPEYAQRAKNGIFQPVVLLNGKIAGIWQRTIKKSGADVSVNMFIELNKVQRTALDKAIEGYKKFIAG